MKLPRNCSGLELANKLAELGYAISRQTGSHIRLTTQQNGEHHITIPHHDPLKVGTFSAVLNEVAKHFLISRDDLIKRLF
ncbi:MAG: type II toxin-antitoxin system HicA family toxin [Methylococcales bacterium]|nr:type II toxin-antitoxin system HicA family toxin [Methylococcales bacterium]MDD5631367.1 type II toxin-antitoxin system HicA family toxin [Methylococcales bacterium]